ncbi:formylglycine-generating enzyme family protein [Aquabacterium sp. A08]|nr:formylglycine-generating enzyme family protein [Aquabacterium sp. A08]NIC41369.1 formylglycine-generating enzyme family protein [Aquabacterium sp. A08]
MKACPGVPAIVGPCRGGRRWAAAGLITATAGAALATVPASPARVALDGWAIDQTEVTIGDFARYAQATGVVTDAERQGGGMEYVGGWQRRPGWTWRGPDGQAHADPRLPAVHLTQPEAEAYCRWAGGTLPTAAQWKQAAYTEARLSPPPPWVRGRTYPWPTGDRPEGANTSGADPWPRAAPAGATRAGVNGLYDMGANVWEWVSDARGEERRTMGGSWWYGHDQMGAHVDAWKPAHFAAVYIGFRCVHPLQRR